MLTTTKVTETVETEAGWFDPFPDGKFNGLSLETIRHTQTTLERAVRELHDAVWVSELPFCVRAHMQAALKEAAAAEAAVELIGDMLAGECAT